MNDRKPAYWKVKVRYTDEHLNEFVYYTQWVKATHIEQALHRANEKLAQQFVNLERKWEVVSVVHRDTVKQ